MLRTAVWSMFTTQSPPAAEQGFCQTVASAVVVPPGSPGRVFLRNLKHRGAGADAPTTPECTATSRLRNQLANRHALPSCEIQRCRTMHLSSDHVETHLRA